MITLLTEQAQFGELRQRFRWMTTLAVLAFLVIAGRLVQLQLVEGRQYRRRSEENFVRTVELPTSRGVIRDRRGRIVATNRPCYNVYVTPHFFTAADEFTRLAELLAIGPEDQARLRRRLDGATGQRRFHQLLAREDIRRDQLVLLETHRTDFPGVDVVDSPIRTYPFGALGAHALGFLNEVGPDELRALSTDGYRAGDRIGRAGIEQAWERLLRGRRGFQKIVVNARGVAYARQGSPRRPAQVDGPMRREPEAGQDLTLSLDMEMTRVVERAFRGTASGAAVVVDVNSGRLLALYSKPTFDLNQITAGLTPEAARELDQNPFRPRIDKTIFENFYPGSTFKIVSALAALEEGILQPRDQIRCEGFHELGRRTFRCSKPHGWVDMRSALIQSCNVYFYKLAELTGMDRIARYANEFGFGVRTGIGINREAAGFIPTRDWYARNYAGAFRLGYTLNSAIGQGNTKVTLLQLALAYAAIANGGDLRVPILISRVDAPDGRVIQEFAPAVRRRVPVSTDHIQYLTDALVGVITDPAGTAYDSRIEGLSVAGKTGTAEVSHRVPRNADDRLRRAWYYNRDHAWFAGFAPVEAPEIALVVLVEHGGNGGKNAAPVAMRIFNDYFREIAPRPAAVASAQPLPPPARRVRRPAASVEPATTATVAPAP